MSHNSPNELHQGGNSNNNYSGSSSNIDNDDITKNLNMEGGGADIVSLNTSNNSNNNNHMSSNSNNSSNNVCVVTVSTTSPPLGNNNSILNNSKTEMKQNSSHPNLTSMGGGNKDHSKVLGGGGGGINGQHNTMPRSQSHHNMSMSNLSMHHNHYHGLLHHSHKNSVSYWRDDISVSFHDTYNDNQKIHQHADIGLTSKKASEILVTFIEDLLNEREILSQFETRKVLFKELFRITPLLYVVGVALLIVAFILEYQKFQALHLIIEAALLLAFLMLHLYMHVREERLEHNETIAKARGHIKRYLSAGDILEDGVTTNSESISVLSCNRDDRWRKVPLNLLVEGDHVSLREGEKVPIMLQCVEPGFETIILQNGDIYTSDLLEAKLLQLNPDMEPDQCIAMKTTLFTSGRCCFRVHEAPCYAQINTALQNTSCRPINPVIKAINYIKVVIERFLWLAVSISFIANIIRALLQKQRSLVDLLIIRQVDLLISFSFIMLPCILLLIAYSIGHAKLLAMFDVLQEQSLKGEISDDHPALNFDTEYVSEGTLPKVPFKLMKNYWEAILSSKHVAFSHSSNLLHHIASTTVLCCIDKEGIVSEPVNTIGEICYYGEEEPVRLELSSEYAHTQYSITFNDSTWKEHLNALKPLGLDCLLNKTCRMYSSEGMTPRNSHSIPQNFSELYTDQASKLQLIRDREEYSDPTNSQCLCLLAKEIGFSDDVSNNYVGLKEIHTLTQRSHTRAMDSSIDNNSALIELVEHSPSMISLVAKDVGNDALQLLSKGSTELILEHCNHYWDGESIVSFSEEEKEKLRQIYHKWIVNEGMRCIAFAYKPIESKFKKLFVTGSINSPLVDVRFSNSVRVPRANELNARVKFTTKEERLLSPMPHHQHSASLPLSQKQIQDLNTSIHSNHHSIPLSPKEQQQPAITEITINDLQNNNIKNRNQNNINKGQDIIIVVESPIPSGRVSPNLVTSNQNSSINTPRVNQLSITSGSGKKKSSKNNKDSKASKNRPRLDSDSSQMSNISSIAKGLKLPPITLEYESGDDSSTAISKSTDVNEEDDYEDDEMDEDEYENGYYTEEDDEEQEDGEDENSNSEYLQNDSETESDNQNNNNSNQNNYKNKNNNGRFYKNVGNRNMDIDTNSYSVSETSESDANRGGRSRGYRQRRGGNIVYDSNTEEEIKHINNSDDNTNVRPIGKITVDEPLDQSNMWVPDNIVNNVAENDTLEQLQNNQIFIGMAGMKGLPKSHANHFVEVLNVAGVRFVYFSNEDRRMSNSFVNKLGLETDWNCCISLKDPGPDEPDLQDGPSRLPKGISAIRKHLEEIDNVPLLVPMFSNATYETKLEMIKILQENGEVVCCLGSALKYENASIFAQADLAFSLEPAVTRCLNLPLSKSDPRPLLTSRNFFETESVTHLASLPIKSTETKRVPTKNPSTESLCCDLTSLPCSLVFHRRTDFNEIAELFHVGRQQLTNTRQCLQFILSASMSLVLMCLVAGILVVSMPRDGVVGGIPLTGLQLMWLEFIIIPLIGYSLLATSGDEDVMKMLSPKNNEEFKHLPTFAKYIAIRLVPSIILTVWFFIWTLHTLSGASWSNMFGALMNEWPDNPAVSYSDALLVSQNIMMFAFVYYLAVTSISFIHHTQSILKFNPLKRNNIWIILVFLSVGLQISFSFISIRAIDGIPLLRMISWELYVVLFCWAVIVILLDEFVKRLYKKWFDDLQLELRLQFDTKLGMYSPK